MERNKPMKILSLAPCGGSAAAVAARMSMGALGTDTGGSFASQPLAAALSGSNRHMVDARAMALSISSSLDQAGVFARTIGDAALLSEVIMGHDEKDSTSANMPVPDLFAAMERNVRGLKVGIPKEYNMENLDPEIKQLWENAAEALQKEGAEVVESPAKYKIRRCFILCHCPS